MGPSLNFLHWFSSVKSGLLGFDAIFPTGIDGRKEENDLFSLSEDEPYE